MNAVETRPKKARLVTNPINRVSACAMKPAARPTARAMALITTTLASTGRDCVGTRAACSAGPNPGATGSASVVDESESGWSDMLARSASSPLFLKKHRRTVLNVHRLHQLLKPARERAAVVHTEAAQSRDQP